MNERRNISERRLSRRAFVQGTAMAGFAAFLAACTGTRSSAAPSAASVSAAPSTAAGESAAPSVAASVAPSYTPTPKNITGPLKFANWPGYIDQASAADTTTGVLPAGSSKTLVDFGKKYSVKVDYVEKIDDNQSFYETIRPALATGLPTGWDLIVLTDWLAAKIITKGWVERVDPENVPNAVNNLRRSPAEPGLGPDERVPLPVAVRHDRHRCQHQDPGGEQHPAPDQAVRPMDHVVRQDDIPDRVPRHVRPRPAQARHRPEPGDRDRRGPAEGVRRHAAPRSTRVCGSSATSTSRTLPRRRSGRHSSGRATWPTRAVPTTSSSSPTRAR